MKAVTFKKSSVLPRSCSVSWDEGCGLQMVLRVAPKFLSGLDEGCDLQKVFSVASRLLGEVGRSLRSSDGLLCCPGTVQRVWMMAVVFRRSSVLLQSCPVVSMKAVVFGKFSVFPRNCSCSVAPQRCCCFLLSDEGADP